MPARTCHISLDALLFPVSIPVIPVIHAIFWDIFAILSIKYNNRISHKINVVAIFFWYIGKTCDTYGSAYTAVSVSQG